MKLKKQRKSIFLLILVLSLLSSFITTALPLRSVEAVSTCAVEKQADVVVVRVYYKSQEDIALLGSFDLFEYNNKVEKYVLIAINRDQINQIEDLGFTVEIDEVETANFQLLFTPIESQTDTGIQTIPGYSCYRTVEETYAAAATIAVDHPNLAEWKDVGDSWEKSVDQPDGYDMMVLILTNSLINGEKPKLFITAAIHAREYTTAELALRFAEYLITNYNSDPDITWILDQHEIHIMFQANPDGRKEAEAGYSWRKNTNENYCGATSTSRGADLNRNYSFYWNSCYGCSSGNPCDDTYRGPNAASEPEVQAIQAYMRSIFQDQRDALLSSPAPTDVSGLFIDLHSYSRLVLWPWGMTSSTAPNGSALQTLGRKFAYFNSYTPEQASDLYPTDGASTDFAYGELGLPAYTFELGLKFFESCTDFNNTIYPDNLQALLYASKVVRTPYQTPAGPETLNVDVSDNVVFEGESVTLTATINDTRYRNTNGTEPTQNISAAEFYVDTPYWEDSASPISMMSVDGAYNETVEDVTLKIDTTGWSQGRHILFVRGQDTAGNWGVISAVFLTVEVNNNERPVAEDKSILTDEDTPVTVLLTGSDPDGNPLTFSVVSDPSKGSLGGIAPNLTYTPEANYFGTDSFTYLANDGIANSSEATVSLTINPVNDAPTAKQQTLSVLANSSHWIALEGMDVDGDSLDYEVVSEPTNGSLRGSPPNILYSPNQDFTGDDEFTFRVHDGAVYSAEATVTLSVSNNDSVTVFWDDFESDKGWTVNPEGTDTATTGLWERANPEAVYYNGDKQLDIPKSGEYDLVTGHLAGASAGSYDIDNGVTSIRSPEILLPERGDLSLSFYYYLSHYTNSSSADYLRVTMIGEKSEVIFTELGAVDNDDAKWEFFSADISSFAGQNVHILIEAADASTGSLVESAIDDVSIRGNMTNTAPTAEAQSLETPFNQVLDITLTGADLDEDPLTYAVVVLPIHGSLSGTVPDMTYTPDSDYYGSDQFEFVSNDGKALSLPATVSLSISQPTAVRIQSLSAQEETPVIIVQWITSNEVGVQGYNVYRSETLIGEIVKLNAELIPPQGYPGSPEGHTYYYYDTTYDQESKMLFYWLEEKYTNGGDMLYGPVKIERYAEDEPEFSHHLFIPLISR